MLSLFCEPLNKGIWGGWELPIYSQSETQVTSQAFHWHLKWGTILQDWTPNVWSDVSFQTVPGLNYICRTPRQCLLRPGELLGEGNIGNSVISRSSDLAERSSAWKDYLIFKMLITGFIKTPIYNVRVLMPNPPWLEFTFFVVYERKGEYRQDRQGWVETEACTFNRNLTHLSRSPAVVFF